MRTKLYQYVLKSVLPFIRFTTYYTKFPGYKYHIAYSLLEPGDVILTTDDKKLTSLVIPGYFAHAALCVSKDKKFEVAEMTHKNFTKSTFFDVCCESTRIVILRASEWSDAYRERVIKKCKSFEGLRYDSEFSLSVGKLYCSELVYHSDFWHTLKLKFERLAGCNYLPPDSLYFCGELSLVYDSNSYVHK